MGCRKDSLAPSLYLFAEVCSRAPSTTEKYWSLAKGGCFIGLPCGFPRENPFFKISQNMCTSQLHLHRARHHNFCISYLPQNYHLGHLRHFSVTQGVCERVQWPHESWRTLVVESLARYTAAVYPAQGHSLCIGMNYHSMEDCP